MSENWVQTWGQSHSALSFFYYPSCKKTFRMVVSSAISGEEIRVRLSNKCGKNDVEIGAVTAALCDESGNLTGEAVKLNFSGKERFTIKKGELLISDSAPLKVKSGEYLAVNMYTENGSLTSGNLLSNVNLITAKGNRTLDRQVVNEPRIRDSVRKVACKVLRMFLHKPIPLFEAVELLNTDGAKAITVFGDSITQQGFWTNAFDSRIRSLFPGEYSVINKAIMGNRVLLDYSPRFICKGLFGQRGTERINNDIFAYENISHVVIFLGVNDVLQYGTITTPKSEKTDPAAICEAYTKMTQELKSRGIKVIMFTIMGFADFADYRPEKGVLRSEVNSWLRENSGMFDSFCDIAKYTEVKGSPEHTMLQLLGPDKLHPNEVGGKFMAEQVDMTVFENEDKKTTV